MLRFGETHRGDRCWVIFESRRSTPHLGVVESRTLLFLHTLRGRILLTKSSYGGGTNHVAIRARSRFSAGARYPPVRRSWFATSSARHATRTNRTRLTEHHGWYVRALLPSTAPARPAGAPRGRAPRRPRRDVVEIQAPFPRGDASVYALRGRPRLARR